ncbi:nitroreductase family protein [Prescottella equi]|uniref:nitroreductase family protein n=1 Tax=Rhodococcus hoagii TaxID=43767 RepID=UPI001585A61E|nr:nitroreductase family protein [Prescottella equi]
MHADAASRNESLMYLRRSIHRIEKGLISRPLRDTFATDYISETVHTFARMWAGSLADREELSWAADVLDCYFHNTQTSLHPEVLRARAKWETIGYEKGDGVPLVPFVPGEMPSEAATYSQLDALSAHRRSTRWFLDKTVPRSALEDAVKVGLHAPSACNRQSFRVLAVDQPDLLQELAKIPMGIQGYEHQIPLLVALIGQYRGYENERDRHVIFVDGGLFANGFILALESMGLSTCCINWPEINSKYDEVRNVIQLDADERIVMLIAVGYADPAQLVPRSSKRPANTVLGWNCDRK